MFQFLLPIDWARGNPVELEALPGSHRCLEVGSNVAGWRLLLAIAYASLWRDRYLYLKEAGSHHRKTPTLLTRPEDTARHPLFSLETRWNRQPRNGATSDP